MLLVRAVTDDAEGWGSAWPRPSPATPRSTPTAPPTCCAASWSRRWPLPATRPRRRPGHGLRQGSPHGQGGPGAGRARRLAAVRGEPLAGHLGATRDRVPAGVSVGIMESVPQLLDAAAGYLDQGYLRSSSRSSPAGTSTSVGRCASGSATTSCSRSTPTAYTLADAGHLANLDRFGLLLIEQPSTRTTWPATPSWPRRRPPRSASTSRSPRPGRRSRPSASAPAASSTSRPAGSAATWRPGASTTPAGSWACPVVRRHAGDGIGRGGQRGPGRPARLHPPRRHLRLRPLLPPGPDRAVRAHRRPPGVLAGPGIGVEPVAGVLEELTTSVEWNSPSGAAAEAVSPTAGCQFTGEVIHGHPRRFQRIRELRQQRLQLRIGDHWAWKSRTDMDGDGESSVLTSYQYLRT